MKTSILLVVAAIAAWAGIPSEARDRPEKTSYALVSRLTRIADFFYFDVSNTHEFAVPIGPMKYSESAPDIQIILEDATGRSLRVRALPGFPSKAALLQAASPAMLDSKKSRGVVVDIADLKRLYIVAPGCFEISMAYTYLSTSTRTVAKKAGPIRFCLNADGEIGKGPEAL